MTRQSRTRTQSRRQDPDRDVEPPDAARRRRAVRPGVVIPVLALAMLLASLGTSIANIALPALAQAFDTSLAQVQWVVTAYLAAMTLSAVLAGGLADRIGLRPVFLGGLWIFCLATGLCALAPALAPLVAARALQGLGAAVLLSLTIAYVRETADESRVGRAMGLLGTVSAIGTALGPALGGVSLDLLGWRGPFAVQLPLALAALILAASVLPAPDRNTAGRSPRPPMIRGLAKGLNAEMGPNLLCNLLVAAVMMSTLVVGPFYLALGLGLDSASAGLAMSVGPAISIAAGVPCGRAVDRWGPRRVLVAGLGMLATGAAALALLPQVAGLVGYLLAIAVLTPGYQLFQAANNTDVMARTAAPRRGTASGLLTLSRNLGLILGASGMGMVFARSVGAGGPAAATPDAIVAGMRITFLLAAAMMGLALALAMTRGAGRCGNRAA